MDKTDYNDKMDSLVKVLLRSKFSAYQKRLYLFRSMKWTLAPSNWKYWAWKCRFFASAITNLCSSEPTVWSCGLIIQSYCPLTCDVIFWTRQEKQTKQRVILKASLVFARFWNCKGGNDRLPWLCRTTTDWRWESLILRAANLREGRNTHFTKSYFMQFVPREIQTTGRCIYIYVLATIIKHRQDYRESAPISPAF